MSNYKLCALTGAMLCDAARMADTPVSLKPVHLHVTYIHTPPVSIFKEYEIPLEYERFEQELPLSARLRELPLLFCGMQAVLNRLHDILLKSPMLALFDSVISQNTSPIQPVSEWHGDDFRACIYRIDGQYTERTTQPHRLLGNAYVIDHPETREEALIWIAPPGMKRAMDLREWCNYLTGCDIRVDREIRDFLKYISLLEV